MKKQLLITALMLIPAMSFAKISDFNEIISESVKSQNELHSAVQVNVEDARDAAVAAKVRERIVVVENSGVSYNSPSRKDLLAFKKEKRSHRASEDKQFERLANEVHSADY